MEDLADIWLLGHHIRASLRLDHKWWVETEVLTINYLLA